MRAVVKKWGNSASVRIPASIMAAAGLRLDQAVEVREENGCVVIEPIKREEYDLAELLAGITPVDTMCILIHARSCCNNVSTLSSDTETLLFRRIRKGIVQRVKSCASRGEIRKARCTAPGSFSIAPRIAANMHGREAETVTLPRASRRLGLMTASGLIPVASEAVDELTF